MSSASDDGSQNAPVELPKHGTEPDVENTGLPLDLPDSPLPFEEMILTSDEQQRVFNEVGVHPDQKDSTTRRKKKR